MKRLLPFLFLLTLTHCQRVEVENRAALQEIYKKYQNGDISECQHNGQLVYSAGINAYDAGGVIYDKNGNTIAGCNYAWGFVDPICRELTNCEVIYRVKNHITGEPPVNKYRLK
ncbi:hypothetical protein GCM10027275_42580 [Rhabdobacter roseus]|uniref:Uncharacterized protein n=1 Tax=Rhabdobacter roseus TaxID=1655419 RepID=A0A840TXC9_9BACT|nr:hypothetical protein [Rhabdobacter roseus]MBB5286237.1 hypothetical protein [Rhabdobacter roseus]